MAVARDDLRRAARKRGIEGLYQRLPGVQWTGAIAGLALKNPKVTRNRYYRYFIVSAFLPRWRGKNNKIRGK